LAQPNEEHIRVRELLTREQLVEGVRRLAAEVTEHYGEKPITIVGVLTGSIVLLADLIRELPMPLRVGLVQASSYRGKSTTPGALVINSSLLPDLGDRDVLLVDDIFDTGHTLFELVSQIEKLRPRSLRSAVLLMKQGRRRVEFTPDHVAFEIPDAFVVGYGLDYNDLYRNLPYLAVLDERDMTQERPV
jgi:hypoxanthine phosphoribosyltransferase